MPDQTIDLNPIQEQVRDRYAQAAIAATELEHAAGGGREVRGAGRLL